MSTGTIFLLLFFVMMIAMHLRGHGGHSHGGGGHGGHGHGGQGGHSGHSGHSPPPGDPAEPQRRETADRERVSGVERAGEGVKEAVEVGVGGVEVRRDP